MKNQVKYRLLRWSVGGLLLLGTAQAEVTLTDAAGQKVVVKDTSRILTMGGAVAETVFALGAGKNVIATDNASFFPAPVNKLPKTGSVYRQISAEGVLALKPSLVITTTEAGPPAALAQLRAAGVPLLLVSAEATPQGAKDKISLIGKALGREAQAETLNAGIDRDLRKARALYSRIKAHPKVTFLYVYDAKSVSFSGKGTAADAAIGLAGGVNAMPGAQGYKPLTAEALVAANPDVIVLPARALGMLGGMEGVLKLPGVAQTTAGKAHRIIAMDDLYLLGFGPRTGRAVQELTLKLHPELEK